MSGPGPTADAHATARSDGLPAWAISVALHAAILAFAAQQLRGCGGDAAEVGTGVESARTVGLVARPTPAPPEADNSDENEAEPAGTAATELSAEIPSAEDFFPDDPFADVFAAADAFEPPPFTAAVPTPVTDAATGGPPADARVVDDGGEVAEPDPLPPGHTLFFGIADGGKQFVYVLDCSGSMAGILAAAKAELRASLAQLDASQKFQVVFYNDSVRTLTLPGRRPSETIPATELNRTLAGRLIDPVDIAGGTDRRLAFEQALAFRPDVVFFLSDTDDPLRAADLEDIRLWNRSAARIHTVEFGLGADTGQDNFLKKIARRHGGTHRYYDVRAFGGGR